MGKNALLGVSTFLYLSIFCKKEKYGEHKGVQKLKYNFCNSLSFTNCYIGDRTRIFSSHFCCLVCSLCIKGLASAAVGYVGKSTFECQSSYTKTCSSSSSSGGLSQTCFAPLLIFYFDLNFFEA